MRLCTVTIVTAEFDDEYFQGFLDGAGIHRAIKSSGPGWREVEYVAPRDVLERLIRKIFWTGDPSGKEDRELLDSIVEV